jgi:hypothetical protein
MTLELQVRPEPRHVSDVLLLGEKEGRRSLADTTRVIGGI